jgi:glycosyltransferase involved in cell wall biosynthesis
MIYLFIHQGFPAQYAHVVRHLAAQRGNTVYFISRPHKVSGFKHARIKRLTYTKPPHAPVNCHPLTVELDEAIRSGTLVADVCRKLRDDGVRPDLIVGHCGWGETLFVKEIFPDTPVLTYFEFYYHAHGADMNFDPEFVSLFQGPERIRTKNGLNLMAFDATDWGHTPTQWQRSLMLPELRGRVTVLHEGVDTDKIKPVEDASFVVEKKKLKLTARDEVVTYIARSLEPYRGFHIFMRALPQILKHRPKAHVVIVGADAVTYGTPSDPGRMHRQLMLDEVGDRIDQDRVHFVGQLPYEKYLQVLQVSSAHVYLTYPFILSWSFIEALASGCLIVGSSTPPVMEVLEDRVNGLAVDFFSPAEIADRVEEVLSHPDRMQSLRDAARRTAVERFDVKTRILPLWQNLFDDLIAGRRPELDP